MSVTDPNLDGPPVPSVQVAEQDPLIGLELGGFHVVRLLAAGGMGLVYEALHRAIGRRAAVKVLKPEVAADAEWTRRFLSEARALGSLKHRNLIEVLNFGKTPDGRDYLMMEFLDGEPLDAYIRRLGQLAPAVALGIVDQILNGLAEAHKKGVVHRDLKPSNVFLLREHNGELLVKVLDFGLARQEPIALIDGAIQLTQRTDGASLLAGTPEYIAPEQAQGRKVEGSADLYSLGVMLFEMVTGRLPFEAESVTALLQKHLSERPPRLSAVMNNAPEGLEEFIESLLQKEPELRPSSADGARVTVQRLLKRLAQDSTAVRAMPVEPEVSSKHAPTMKIDRPIELQEKPRRGWVWALVALIVLLLMGVLLAGRGQPEKIATPVAEVTPVVVAPVVVTPVVTPEPVAEPVKVTAPPDDMVALPSKLETPKPKTELVVRKVFIDSVECQPTADWKKRLGGDLAQMGNEDRVLKNPKLYELWDRSQPNVVGQVNGARTVSECVAAQLAYEKLKGQLGF